jgi:predicted amidophosphoribosyltransferase
MSPETAPAETFTWPPSHKNGQTLPSTEQDAPSTHPLASLVESVERDLLGRVGLSFDQWAARTSWQPDQLDAFCWRCAGSVGPHEQDGEGCAACRSTKFPWDRALRLSSFHGEIREEVLALKFHAWRPGGRALGAMLGQRIREQLELAQIPPEMARIVPVPMHTVRRIHRGIDHTLVIAKNASTTASIRLCRLLGAKYRPEQVGRSPTARARNMRNAFYARNMILRRGRRSDIEDVRVWVLIDDVRTTGATLTAASKALRSGLNAIGGEQRRAAIWVCSVGVTPSRDRHPNL